MVAPDIRYTKSGSLNIAYQVLGNGPSTSFSWPGGSRTSTSTGRNLLSRGSFDVSEKASG